MTAETFKHYLRDLGYLIRDNALEAAGAARRDRSDAFARGRSTALYEVVSLMQSQALVFDLDVADLSLDGIDPERDLI